MHARASIGCLQSGNFYWHPPFPTPKHHHRTTRGQRPEPKNCRSNMWRTAAAAAACVFVLALAPPGRAAGSGAGVAVPRHSVVRGCCGGEQLGWPAPAFSWHPFVIWNADRSDYGGFIRDVFDWLEGETGVQINSTASYTDFFFGGVQGAALAANFTLKRPFRATHFRHDDPTCFLSKHLKDHIVTGSYYRNVITVATLRSSKNTGAWALFEPFAGDLWQAVLASVALTAVLMVVIHLLVAGPEDDGGAGADAVDGDAGPAAGGKQRHGLRAQAWRFIRELAKTTYHSLALLLGGEEYEWGNWPGRVLRLGALLLTLILVATYVRVSFLSSAALGMDAHVPCMGVRCARRHTLSSRWPLAVKTCGHVSVRPRVAARVGTGTHAGGCDHHCACTCMCLATNALLGAAAGTRQTSPPSSRGTTTSSTARRPFKTSAPPPCASRSQRSPPCASRRPAPSSPRPRTCPAWMSGTSGATTA